MIALSTRQARWLVLLLAAALVPIVLEAVRPRRHDDCRHPDMLTLTLAIPGSKPSPRRPGEDGRNVGGDAQFTQWTEGQVEGPDDGESALQFWIIRAWDAGAASPRRVLREAFDPEVHEVRELASEAGPLPVHVAIDRTRSPGRLVAWTWIYDGQPTADIFPALLRAAPRRLVTGSVPVTLLLVDGVAGDRDPADLDGAATKWLAGAWSHIARYCR